MTACCNGCITGTLDSFRCSAYQAGSPSSVVMALPATFPSGVTQDRVSTPSTRTEHEPHCASPHPKRGPWSASSFDRTYKRGVSAGASISCTRWFTVIRVAMEFLLGAGASLNSLSMGRVLQDCQGDVGPK